MREQSKYIWRHKIKPQKTKELVRQNKTIYDKAEQYLETRERKPEMK
jgi:hypothetical protein